MENWKYPGFIARHQLLESRWWWTQELIDKYLIHPDQYVPNYLHNSEQTMRLFDLGRVFRAEQKTTFKTDVLKIHKQHFSTQQFYEMSKTIQKQKNQQFKKNRLKERLKESAIKSALKITKTLEEMGLL